MIVASGRNARLGASLTFAHRLAGMACWRMTKSATMGTRTTLMDAICFVVFHLVGNAQLQLVIYVSLPLVQQFVAMPWSEDPKVVMMAIRCPTMAARCRAKSNVDMCVVCFQGRT